MGGGRKHSDAKQGQRKAAKDSTERHGQISVGAHSCSMSSKLSDAIWRYWHPVVRVAFHFVQVVEARSSTFIAWLFASGRRVAVLGEQLLVVHRGFVLVGFTLSFMLHSRARGEMLEKSKAQIGLLGRLMGTEHTGPRDIGWPGLQSRALLSLAVK